MRVRLASTILAFAIEPSDLAAFVERDQGVRLPGGGRFPHEWREFLHKGELRDVLDLITTFYRRVSPSKREPEPRDPGRWIAAARAAWLSAVAQIFREEGVRYRVDELGGVHFALDVEFERSRTATLSGLGGARYANVLAEFERAYVALDQVPPDAKAAIRAVFFACEGLFRLMFSTGVLGVDEIERHLGPRIDGRHGNDHAARVASRKAAKSFREWVIAAHQYRHEPGTEEPAQPPLGLAVLMVSQGASFLRWLAELDHHFGASLTGSSA